MKIGKTMGAVVLAAFACAALPAMASAQPELEIGGAHFTLEGEHSALITSSSKVTCTGLTGAGEFEGNPSTSGTVSLSFTGCGSGGTSCGTEAAGSGEVTVEALDFDLVTATDAEGGEATDAMLITPSEPNEEGTGSFATFKCAFGLVTVEVRGTGLIGKIAAPGTNKESATFEIDFAQHEEELTQTYEAIEGSEGALDLEMKVGSGEWKTAVATGTANGTFHLLNKLL